MNTSNMNTSNTIEQFRSQVKDNFDTLFNTPKSLPSVFLNGTNAYISVANNPDINFGTGTFSVICEDIFENGSTIRYKMLKTLAAEGFIIRHDASNKISISIRDANNTWTIISTNAITDGKFHVIGFVCGIDSNSSKLFIDGLEDTTASKSGTFPTLTKTNTLPLYIGSWNTTFHKTETRLNRLFNYALTNSQIQKYSYEDLAYEDVGGNNTDLTLGNGSFATDTTSWWGKAGGTLTWNSGTSNATFTANGTGTSQINTLGGLTTLSGKRYRISFKAKSSNITSTFPFVGTNRESFVAVKNQPLTATEQTYIFEGVTTASGDSFFIRTGTNLTAGQEVTFDDIVIQQIGCVLNLAPDTINPLKWNCKNGLYYADLINGEAINLPIDHNANVVYKGITGNSTVVVPKGYAIEMIYIKNTTANAITGGIKIGTTAGGTDVISAFAVAGNFNGVVSYETLLKKFFSDTANTTLYLQAVTAWNSASINVVIGTRRVV